MIHDPAGVLTILIGIAALFFYLERRTRWRLFDYFPPLIFIYALPVVLSNTGILPTQSPVYDGMRGYGLYVLLTLLLLDVDLRAALRVLGRGIGVMLFGTLGVVVGAPLAYLVVHRFLSENAWTGYGALAGSWIGGTGNMGAVAEALQAPGEIFGLAVLADNVVYMVWLPILLGARNYTKAFARFTGIDHGTAVEKLEAAAGTLDSKRSPIAMRHVIYLGLLGFAVTWLSRTLGAHIAASLSARLPQHLLELFPVVNETSIVVVLVTTAGLALSATPARRIPGSHDLAMAIVYVFVAVMGARASVAGFGQALPFVAGAFLWIGVHGAFCLLGARLLKVDVHTAAIASAANIGGAASAPVVASYHNEKLVPVSILMAILGYAIGTYAALLAAQLTFLAGKV